MASKVARPVRPPAQKRRQSPSPTPQNPLAALHARYVLLDKLGAGCAGTVVRAIEKASKKDVAVKIVPKRQLVDRTCKMALAREVSVLSRLSHANVLHFSNAFEDTNHVYIATEYCPDGDLHEYLRSQNAGLSEREALKYLRQIFYALAYLHARGISHRDVKPENVLMGPNGRVKLADFGLCYWRRPGGEMTTRQHCGTPQYAAPEIMNKQPYVPEKGDMWSCGVMLYAMLTRTLPFKGASWYDLQASIIAANPDDVVATPALSHVSSGTISLLKQLLNVDPSQRPNPKDAVDLVDDALLGSSRPSRSSSQSK